MKQSIFWRLFTPILILFIICLLLISWYVPSAIRANAEKEAILNAERTVNEFKTIRKYYTENIISKVVGKDNIKGSINHKNEKNSIPLPATMIHDLTQELKPQGTTLKLYSAYPFPNRKDQKLDDFGSKAWEALKANPSKVFSLTENSSTGTIVRVGIADLMVSPVCVACHNSHPQTPKSDWKINDVRGVLEIQMNIDQQIANGQSISYTIIAIMVVLGIFMSLILMFIYRSAVGSRLNTIGNALCEISQGDGDLTQRLDASGQDEVSAIAKGFNHFVSKIEATVKEIKQATHSLSSTSATLVNITEAATSAIQQQDSQTEQVATAITELSASAHEISNHAADAAETTSETDSVTTNGEQIVTESMQATNTLAADVRIAANALNKLQEDSDRITGVLDVIKGIAEQTNLLALNAAIEAARAGEQGRGFAVVADEVRTLAARTQESTTEIQDMTERLRSATDQAVMVMDKNQLQADESVSLSQQARNALEVIAESINKINTMNTHVATAAKEQNSVVDSIEHNINDMVSLSGITSQSTYETKNQVEILNEIVTRINSFTDHFKVSD